MKPKIEISTKRSYTLDISREQILEWMESQGLKPQNPDKVEIFVQVPTGGDYSGLRLDIGSDVHIRINWQDA